MTRAYSILACVLVLAGCGGDPDPMPMDGGPATVTYEQVEAIMMTSCAFATCHGGAGAGAA